MSHSTRHEKYFHRLVDTRLPGNILRLDKQILTTIGAILPDFEYRYSSRSLIEITLYPQITHKDHKDAQRRILKQLEIEQPQYNFMILYLEHFIELNATNEALELLHLLNNREISSQECESKLTEIAQQVTIPSDLNVARMNWKF